MAIGVGIRGLAWACALSVALCLLPGCSSSDPSPGQAQPVADGGVPPPLTPLCKSDGECSAGQHCDPLKGCVACLFDSDCADGSHCEASACTPVVPCSASGDCASGQVCDPTSSVCVACLLDNDCGANQRCRAQHCQAYIPCVNSLDCSDSQVCDRNAGECVGCVVEGDCAEGYTCAAAQCVPRCKSDKDCAAADRLCDVAQGHCVQCVEQQDCPDVYHCSAGRCELDICQQTDVSCLPSEPTIKKCNALGDGYDLIACASQQSCTSSSGTPSCADWLCAPGSLSCDTSGQYVLLCNADGLAQTPQTDCMAASQVCSQGECKDKVCEPGKSYCKDGASYSCSADGTVSELVQTCGSGSFCDAASAQCLPQVCTPNSSTCDGNTISTCLPDGSGVTGGGQDCTQTAQVCYNAQCLPQVCTGGKHCKSGAIYNCSNNGTSETLSQSCGSFAFCDPNTVSCQTQKCSANQAICNGNLLTTCAADGSGPAAGGTDCSANGQVCSNAACVPKVCDASQSFYCKGGDVYTCAGNGSLEQLYTTCPTGYACDATTLSCKALTCAPSSPTCNGSVATTCSADGKSFTSGGTDCAATGKVCVSGSCLPKVCNAPGQYYCSGSSIYVCAASGAATYLYQDCSASYYYCMDGTSYCQYDLCTAGTPMCNGNVATACAPDGSGAAAGGTDCSASNKVCDTGACKDLICTPNQNLCSGGNVQRCNARGTGFTLYQTCAATQYCDTTAAACRPDVCTAGTALCSGESQAVCNSDGSGIASTGTDCSSAGQICDLTLGCSASALDTLGSSTTASSASNTLFYTAFSADTSRHLTQIEQYFSVSGTTVFTWVVYSASALNGVYTKAFEITTSGSGVGFQSSGAINVSLSKGSYYLIGVLAQGSYSYYYKSPALPAPVSFGEAFASSAASATALPSTRSFSYAGTTGFGLNQRLSTAP